MTDIERQLKGYRLTTAEIVYRMPDHLHLLQTYVWQSLDLVPDFPELRKFLQFWEREIEGPLHSVKVGNTELLAPGRTRHVDASFALH
ncbi:MAG: Usg family protein [Rhodospirillaceae bacterium]